MRINEMNRVYIVMVLYDDQSLVHAHVDVCIKLCIIHVACYSQSINSQFMFCNTFYMYSCAFTSDFIN